MVWTEDGLKRIRIERSTRVKYKHPNVRVDGTEYLTEIGLMV
jgi:hypothetical protein